MAFLADYPSAIVVEAANYGYSIPNRPKTFGFHTPEEPADSYPSTPEYLRKTDRDASYTYFVSSWLALAFQLVPEGEGAYAHGLEGKPEPSWSDGSNLNLQSLSLSFEGHAATIHQTMPRGCPQWVAGVNLVAHRTKALGLNLDWAFQHKDVSNQRGDCGAWNQAAFIADVKAKMEEDDMALSDEDKAYIHAQIKAARDEIAVVKGKVETTFNEVRTQASAVAKVVRDTATSGGGSTPDEIKEAVKEAQREGTG